ncbi:hypothetical protein [Sporosarcina sp. FSL K6-3457]|uniref:hypothetical protein n=1 Tax=Sporosarcina sp. FSL K6-3457 TaxID=2978204 RepID=UPI0030F839A1
MKKRTMWTEELIKSELMKSIGILGVDRMPSAEELKSIGRNDLHCKISKTKKYSGWANELGLGLKNSETTLGHLFEGHIERVMKGLGFKAERMSTKHPYDLLVEGTVKVDVKVANPYLLKGKHRTHTFRLGKVDPTCDIYICVLLDEKGRHERRLVIPSHHVRLPMLNMGTTSKYHVYDEKFEYIRQYVDFFKKIS